MLSNVAIIWRAILSAPRGSRASQEAGGQVTPVRALMKGLGVGVGARPDRDRARLATVGRARAYRIRTEQTVCRRADPAQS